LSVFHQVPGICAPAFIELFDIIGIVRRSRPYPPSTRFDRAKAVGVMDSVIFTGAGGGAGGGLGFGMLGLHTGCSLLLFFDDALDELDDRPSTEPMPDSTVRVIKGGDGHREPLF
jgi:hypothetical protein